VATTEPLANRSGRIEIRRATPADVDAAVSILNEAAEWLIQRGMGMWRDDELNPQRIARDVADGLFYLAWKDEPVGTVKFQLSDAEFWPDLPGDDAAYIHRLAVRRAAAGRGVSTALMTWAVERTAANRRRFVRLDCEAARPRLRAVYERFGFRHHSDRQVGPYFVSRYELDVEPKARSTG
jgi:GNAT superfamily N-acetyltransferase